MQKKILDILFNADDYISEQSISEKLNISQQSVAEVISTLKSDGYVFECSDNKIKLVALPSHLNEICIKHFLRTKIIGKNLTVLDTVTSTNDYLKDLGNKKCENGTVVCAREQTKGKGRLGRTWLSKKDNSVIFSILLRPEIAPHQIAPITPLAGLALCKAIRKFTGLDCRIKWPNDIIVGRKKLSGILTEMVAEFDAVEYIVIGIGINFDQAVFPEEIAHKATSVMLETGRHYNKNELLACILEHIENEFIKHNLELSQTALTEYINLCDTVGKNITFQSGTRRVSGIAVGVADNGELKVMLSNGTIRHITSGEVFYFE